jgi:heme exporter protein B
MTLPDADRLSAVQPPAHAGSASGARLASLRRYFRTVGAIVWKDLAAELRSKELLGALMVFALLVILIFNFALELNPATQQTVAGGVLWVATIFTATLGLNRSLAIEMDRGSLDGLLLAPMDRSAL